MTQTLIDPRMFDTSQALGAHDASSLTNVPAGMSLVNHTSITSSTVDIQWTSLSEQMHVIYVWNLQPVNNNVDFRFHASTDNGSTYIAGTSYARVSNQITSSVGGEHNSGSNGTSSVQLHGNTNMSNGAGGSLVRIEFCRDAQNSTEASGMFQTQIRHGSDIATTTVGSFQVYSLSGNDIDAIKLDFSSGNISTAEASLFSVAT